MELLLLGEAGSKVAIELQEEVRGTTENTRQGLAVGLIFTEVLQVLPLRLSSCILFSVQYFACMFSSVLLESLKCKAVSV